MKFYDFREELINSERVDIHPNADNEDEDEFTEIRFNGFLVDLIDCEC